jgi:hypothetical protein
MKRLTNARQRLAAATDLPGLLDAAYDAFEDMLLILRRHQEDDNGAFAAFVMAAAAAANGRDWIAGADALPPTTRRDHADDLPEGATDADVARTIAALSSELVTRLTASVASVADAGDRLCCDGAATEATTITALLSGTNPP